MEIQKKSNSPVAAKFEPGPSSSEQSLSTAIINHLVKVKLDIHERS